MQHWRTILTFNFPHEAQVAKLKLESEDIQTYIQDELTLQIYHFYSSAMGGVKLKVPQKDYNYACRILEKAGYTIEDEPVENPLLDSFILLTERIVFLRKYPLVFRLFFLFAVIAIPLAALAFLLIEMPSPYWE